MVLLALPAPAAEITVLYTGETHSMLGPCKSCPVEPYGGLARRATEVERIRRGGLQPTLLLDTGGMFAGGIYDQYTLGPAVDIERTRANLRAIAKMGYDALCIGDEEIAYGSDFLREAADLAQAPFVSANLTLADGSPPAGGQPYVIRKAGDKSFAIIGVTTPDTYAFPEAKRPDGFAILDPVASVRRAVEEVRARVDFVVLLSHLGEDETRSLIEKVPGIDIALNGHRKSTGDLQDAVGQTLFANFNYQGRRLSRLDLRLTEEGSLDDFRVRELPLSERVPDDPDIAAMVKAFDDRLASDLAAEAQIQLDLYVMAECPFAHDAEQIIYPAVLEFGRERIRVRRFYVVHENPDGSLGSLHGPAEIAADMQEICLEKIYGDRLWNFLSLRGAADRSGSWEDWARAVGLDAGPVAECLDSPYPDDVLRRHWIRTGRMKIDASPTIYINNKELVLQAPLTRERFLAALCSALPAPIRPDLCAQLPECFSNADCQQPGKIGECVNPGQPDAHCVFSPPVEATLRILTSSQARLEDTSGILPPMMALFPGLRVEEVDVDSPEGRKLAEQGDVRWLPAYFIEQALEQSPNWKDVAQSAEPVGEYYRLKPEFTGANIDYRRTRQDGRLDLFLSALSPKALEVAASLVDDVAAQGKDGPWDLVLHWLIYRAPVPDAGQGSTGALAAPGGIAEIEEACRQVAILNHHPAALPAYLRERAKVGNSSYWDVPLKAAGLDPEEIRRLATGAENLQRLSDDAGLAAEFGLSGAAILLYANQELVDVPDRAALRRAEERIGLGPTVVTLAYTGNLNGLLEACGCPGNPFGGMARIGTALKSVRDRSPNTILVDAGDFFPAGPMGDEAELWDEEADLVKLPYLLRAAEALNYGAMAIGEQEFVFGEKPLVSLLQGSTLPLFSSNIEWDGGKLGEPIRTIQVGHRKVVLLSLTSPSAFSFAPEAIRAKVQVRDPLECANAWLKRAYSEAEPAARQATGTLSHDAGGLADAGAPHLAEGLPSLVVVLFHGTLAEARAFAQACAMVDVVVLGHPGKMLQKPEQVGHALIVSAGRNGENLGELSLRLGELPGGAGLRTGPEVVHARLIPLDDSVAEDPQIRQIIAEYDERAAQRFAEAVRQLADIDPGSLDTACAKCHQDQYEQWRSTSHAHALEALEAVGKQNSPDCAACHTTRPLDRTKALLPSVSCVACHDVGPIVSEGGQARHEHVTRPVRADACLACHTRDRSPNFAWETYRARVVH